LSKISGGCLCGDIRYVADGKLRPVMYCHCEQCRRTSGHFVAATACAKKDLVMVAEVGLSWYRSSSTASRGFCVSCGSSVFWQAEQSEYISIMAGTIDAPTELGAREHIFVADASDYYTIDDGLPQFSEREPLDARK
jgi:hypothetical protein